MAKRTARTAAWAVLAGLVAARFVSESVPLVVQAVVGAGAALGTDWFLRWREGARQRDERSGRARREER